jgi:hypothetical protein
MKVTSPLMASPADWAGIALSTVCAVHCLLPLTPPWIALAGLGAWAFSPGFESWLQLSLLLIAATILSLGFHRHRQMRPALLGIAGGCAMLLAARAEHSWEPLLVVLAATFLCLAHYRNWRHLQELQHSPHLP